jgi:N-acetylglucosaminyldiphosphoundecaprenol N-acetyl-beta-D-mannosaminyltransferase
MRIDVTSYDDAERRVLEWVRAGESRYVCAAAVNNLMVAYDSPDYLQVMNQADLVTPDGMPLVWSLRLMGARSATRVYGPDLTWRLLDSASREGLPVGFYGSTRSTLETLAARVRHRFPSLRIAYQDSPPFRQLTAEEDARTTEAIRRSGARILFVGLGAPKQERWMAAHRGRIPAVMVGVGAAFDFLAGVKRQAPRWMQRSGLEWFFRLICEPRRLAPRYLKGNPRFVMLCARELLLRRLRAV